MTEQSTEAGLIAALPVHLHERARSLKDAPVRDGRYVLYWIHHAVRGHENPALDAALVLGNGLGLPVLVYQGLGGRHRFNNDRHHHFILEGARDAHREITARGIRTVFHLGQDTTQPSPLGQLINDAAVLVVEDYPAPPFPQWTERLAAKADCPVIAVDGHCIVPMQSQPKRFGRAFEFRRHNQSEFDQRVPLDWHDVNPEQAPYTGQLPFEPLELNRADFSEWVARCPIDHSVPPVSDTRGGSNAGYERWKRFRREGLRRYADLRNDAAVDWPRGVSRLSPYLHHGHVSPLRIAREAAASGGKGADKFLDELLIWRELAFNFCFFTRDPESLDCLPPWAQDTLADHADDVRPQLIDDESLARARTHDELWDLMQGSLLRHGELHNNLRMTWAKAIPHWTRNPQHALRQLITLNHRYALDGNDPNSYGGLLWTLGLFDRPFEEQPVSGKLRARSTKAHAKRLDVAHYRARIIRPGTGEALKVAVIGAGLSGLAAARTLHDQGHKVTVFEKSRGPGGRAATRRYDDIGFDHGAQYFTARDAAFQDAVAAWQQVGVVAPWQARLACYSEGKLDASPDDEVRYVGVPGMNALGKYLAKDLTVLKTTRVAPPRFEHGQWHLRADNDEALGRFDALVVAAPAPQAAELLATAAPELADIAAGVVYDPTWAAMLFVDDPDPVGFDGIFIKSGPLRWAARNHSKPARQGQTWVAHAGPEWTRDHLGQSREDIGALLSEGLAELLNLPTEIVKLVAAHSWLYSLVPEPLQVGALWDADTRLAVCGDWCQGARIEGAYLSGIAAAGRLMGHQYSIVTKPVPAPISIPV